MKGLYEHQVSEAEAIADVLVSNAGICPFSEFLTMPAETWERTRQVNLDGSFHITQGKYCRLAFFMNGAVTHLHNSGSRREPDEEPDATGRFYHWYILHLCAGWWRVPSVSRHQSPLHITRLTGGIPLSHYTPTKAGILSLMQSCAVALGKYNIRANAVLPGTIETDINKEDLSDVAKRDGMVKRTVLGRLGGMLVSQRCDFLHTNRQTAPEDIAGPVVFLASDLARYVTGAQILADGGLFVNLQ